MEVKWDPKEAPFIQRELKAWPAKGLYKVAVVDADGKVQASVDGTVPKDFTITKDIFKIQKMENYQIGSELFHSVDQNPGKVGNECVISEAHVYVNGAPQKTTFTDPSVKIFDWDTTGVRIYPATSHEWDLDRKTLGPQGWKMWDKVMEY